MSAAAPAGIDWYFDFVSPYSYFGRPPSMENVTSLG